LKTAGDPHLHFGAVLCPAGIIAASSVVCVDARRNLPYLRLLSEQLDRGYLGPFPAFADSADFDTLRLWAVTHNEWKGPQMAAVIVADDDRVWYVFPQRQSTRGQL
jgi:hypothetical protein